MSSAKDLIEIDAGVEAEIVTLEGGEKFQARLNSMGLHVGSHIKKLSKVGMGGPIILAIDRAQIAVGRGMARKIKVNECYHV